MVTNYELKLKARMALKDNWQTALLVALIASLPSLVSQVVQIMTGSSLVTMINSLTLVMQQNPNVTDVVWLMEEAGITLEACLPSTLLGLVSALVSPFLALGLLDYFFRLLQGEKDAPVSTVFSRKNCFFKAIGLRIVVYVRIFLWMLPGMALMLLPLALVGAVPELALNVLPVVMVVSTVLSTVLGIRAALHYAMADRVMAEAPGKGISQCIRESVGIMRYRKMLLLTLEISFFLWQIGLLVLESLLSAFGTVLASTLSMALSFALNIYIQLAVSAFYLAYRQPTEI